MTERLNQANLLAVGAVLCAAPLLGVLAGIDPRYALAAALGGAFVAFVLQDLTVGMGLMAFLASLDGVPALSGGAISAPKLAGLLLGISWLATVTTRREAGLIDRRPVLAYVLVVFLGWQAVTMAWAEDRDQSIDTLVRYAPNLLLVVIAYSALRTERHLRLTVLALLGGIFVSAILSVVGAAGDDRAIGLAGGANELGAAMVVGVILFLATTLMRRPSGLLTPVLAAGCALCLFALFLSLSRGGLVALAAALAFAVVVAGRWRGPMLVAAGITVLAGVAYFGAVASLPARERVLEVGGGTGRTDLWTVGWRMVEDRPLLGIGAGNFEVSSIHYLLRPGAIEADEFIISVPKVAHNSLLEVTAESGLPGLVLFSVIVLAGLVGMYRGARAFERAGDRDMELLARGLTVATVGYLVAAMFITANYSKLLWVLLALGPVVQAIGGRAAQGAARSGDDVASERPAASRASQGPPGRRATVPSALRTT